MVALIERLDADTVKKIRTFGWPYLPPAPGSLGSATSLSLSQPSCSSVNDSVATHESWASRSLNAVYSDGQQ